MHDHGEFARNGNGGALEADLLLEFQAPNAQRAVRSRSRQDHDGGFVEQAAQMIVAAPRDVCEDQRREALSVAGR